MSTNIQLLSAIRPSDIPAEYADLVEVLGLDGFLTLVDLFRLSERQIRKIVNGTRV